MPLLIPEVNHEHLASAGTPATAQQYPQGGFIVTNPNCSTIMLALALAPFTSVWRRCRGGYDDCRPFRRGLSGSGVTRHLDNVLPDIASEEEKIEQETAKDSRGFKQTNRIRANDC